ncbi:xanthine dehydrogenase accessory protein XdhC [Amaricoccus sp. W119]|uniref:xanthine dehydrogenase accessory protein XdhC n=1 Tax=Amaricoccus sp. W119 TaxID=3391833 RepID=UPI0039A465E3
MTRHGLERFFARHADTVRVLVTRVRGSAPRDEGTEMYVARDGLFGTIGGGQLEYIVIDEARALLARGRDKADLDVPLGPEIGQCCGGRVEIALTRMSAEDRRDALAAEDASEKALPELRIFGAGHVGRALANLTQHLPVRTMLVDTRREELDLCEAEVETRLSAIPEAEVESAPPGTVFVVATHDHGLDFLITAAALQRADAAYVGLIGSKSKRAKFSKWCREVCDGLRIGGLTCPIGAAGTADKRPAVIAAFVAAELMAALTTNAPASARLRRERGSGTVTTVRRH